MDRVFEVIENNNLEEMIRIIEDKVNEYDISSLEVAAAFLKMQMGDSDTSLDQQAGMEFGDTGAQAGMVRLFINLGKKQKIRPGDILGAIAGETGMPGKLIGSIDMYDKYTFVEVPREYAAEVIQVMKNSKIKGKSINVEPANKK